MLIGWLILRQNPTGLEDIDGIRMCDGCRAMCNHNAGDVHIAQGLGHLVFGQFIQMAGGFIQKQDFRFAVERACQNDALLLPARKPTAHITYQGFKPHWHAFDIIFLDIQDSPEHNHEKVRTNPYSRYPLCNGGLDRVIGSIRAEDVLASVVDPSIAPSGRPHSNPIARMRREVLSVPETLNLWDTLAQFDTHGTGFALIVNEYGLVVGLITFKDIMGVLMDGLASPFEEQAIVKRDENSWLVDGAAPIGDVIRELHVLDLPDSEQFDTIGGFIMHRLRRMARKADRVDAAGFRFEVVDVEGFRINQLLVTRMTETS